MYSAVNLLTNSPNILDLTKADFFQLNLSQNLLRQNLHIATIIHVLRSQLVNKQS